MARRQLTDAEKARAEEQRLQRLDELSDKLETAIEAMQAPEGWKDWLNVATRLPSYSVNNQLVLLRQAIERGTQPVLFASFNRWKQAGYPVEKGETAFRIYGPVLKSKPHDPVSGNLIDEETAKTMPKNAVTWKKIPIAYKPVPTFGIEQTAAAHLTEIPEEMQPPLLQGRAPDGLVDALSAYAEKQGATIETRTREQLGDANGYFRHDKATGAKLVVVCEDLEDAARAKTLLHEIAHMHLHIGTEKPQPLIEIEAESTAYLVAGTYGLDTSDYTFPYVGGWSGWDADRVKETARTVRQAAIAILDGLSPAEAEVHDATTVVENAVRAQNVSERASNGPTAGPGASVAGPAEQLAQRINGTDTSHRIHKLVKGQANTTPTAGDVRVQQSTDAHHL